MPRPRQSGNSAGTRPPLVRSTTLPSGEPVVVTIRDDNTITASFPDRRRVYRHKVSESGDDLYTYASRPGFSISDTTSGELTLRNAFRGGQVYIWYLDDAEASRGPCL